MSKASTQAAVKLAGEIAAFATVQDAVDAINAYDPRDHYWIVGGDDARRWSSAVRGYVRADADAYVAFLDGGGLPTRIKDEAELWAVLREQAPAALPDAETYVLVATVRERLEAIELWDDMIAKIVDAGGFGLLAKILTLRWGILATDPQARALIAAIGADPDVILAEEPAV